MTTPRATTPSAEQLPRVAAIPAEPYAFDLEPQACALVVIDMQRDFLEAGGFGASLGNDVSRLRSVIGPLARLVSAWRAAGLQIVHTREGHRSDLADLPRSKKLRARGTVAIGDRGPMGRLLIRGEPGHSIVPELAPLPGEPIVDKPGKGAFHATGLHELLTQLGIRQLIITGVTTEVCVHSTLREANDRGYDCLIPSDCVGSYFEEFHRAALKMVSAQGGIFGWVSDSGKILATLNSS